MKLKLSEHFTYKKLIKFTFPTIIMMIFTSVYGVVDGLFVSNCVGSEAFAGVNLIMPVIMILGSIGFMIGAGGSALVSITMGEGKAKRANEYFSMLVYALIISGIIISVIGFIFIRQISILLGAEGNLIDICVTYGRVLIIAMTAFFLQNCFQSFLVAAEKPKLGLAVSIAAGIVNMLLDFLFVFVLQGGVLGAALATAISQAVGGFIPLIYFIFSRTSSLRLVKTGIKIKPLVRACANGSSEMVTNVSMSLVNMLYNLQLLKYAGSDGVVAYGIIMYVSFIFVGTYLGYSVGCAPIVAYHYGAENYGELKSLLSKSVHLTAAAAVIMTVLAELFSGALAGIFVGYDAQLRDFTANALRLFSLSFAVSGISIFASSFFTALNNGVVSALISFLRTFVFQVAMIFILPSLWGINGIWLAVVFAELLSFAVSAAMIISNRKKYRYF